MKRDTKPNKKTNTSKYSFFFLKKNTFGIEMKN